MMNNKVIYYLQIASMVYIWLFVSGVAYWIINLIFKAQSLRDSFDLSLGISIVVIPVFFTLAIVLTYVFVGLQKGKAKKEDGRPVH